MKIARYYENLEDDKVRCILCPHFCLLGDGDEGICRGRINKNGKLTDRDYELIKNKPAIFVPKVNLDNNGTAIIWPIIFTLKYLDILKKRKEKNINSQTSELKNEADLMDIIYEENEKLFDLIEQNQNLCTKIEKYKKSQQKLIDSHIKDIYKFIENNVNQIKSITKNFSNGLDS